MMDSNKHKFFLFQILKDIYKNKELAGKLGFKGGTALMFFYDLPRFSVDLDFNLLVPAEEKPVYKKVRDIVLKYGRIYDEAIKHYGILCVLDHGMGERKLKVEISNRDFGDRYEVKNLFGINMQVMVKQDMFAHKLCALLDRNALTNRDIFDCWFFMDNKTAVNQSIVETRMEMPLADYLQKCIDTLEESSDKSLLNGLGELMDGEMKQFVRTKLHSEAISLLRFYMQYPILAPKGK